MNTLDILIIEKDTDVRDALVQILLSEGFSALGAADCEEALGLLEPHSAPRMILVDSEPLPEQQWSRLSALLKTPRTQGIPVGVLSTSTCRTSRDRAREAGASAFIRKPFDIDALITEVTRYCGSESENEVEVA